jgi:chitin disaccharide deacetylase
MSSALHCLILHADDLGMNRAVSDGILRGFGEGLLTSTSLLANAPDAGRALGRWKILAADHAAGRLLSTARRAKLHDPQRPFDLGVHLNLTQGRPLSGSRYPAELLDPAGRFPGVFVLFSQLRRHARRFQQAMQTELEQQVQVVLDHGIQPTHLNGHQYIEMLPAITEILPPLFQRFDIKVVRAAREPSLLRSTVFHGQFWKWPLACIKQAFAKQFCTRMDALGITHPDVFFGTAHAGGIDLSLLQRFLTGVTSDPCVEVGLHPGEASQGESPEDRADGWHDPLADCRPHELRMLTAGKLPAFLKSAGWRLGRLS